eukprot:403346328
MATNIMQNNIPSQTELLLSHRTVLQKSSKFLELIDGLIIGMIIGSLEQCTIKQFEDIIQEYTLKRTFYFSKLKKLEEKAAYWSRLYNEFLKPKDLEQKILIKNLKEEVKIYLIKGIDKELLELDQKLNEQQSEEVNQEPFQENIQSDEDSSDQSQIISTKTSTQVKSYVGQSNAYQKARKLKQKSKERKKDKKNVKNHQEQEKVKQTRSKQESLSQASKNLRTETIQNILSKPKNQLDEILSKEAQNNTGIIKELNNIYSQKGKKQVQNIEKPQKQTEEKQKVTVPYKRVKLTSNNYGYVKSKRITRKSLKDTKFENASLDNNFIFSQISLVNEDQGKIHGSKQVIKNHQSQSLYSQKEKEVSFNLGAQYDYSQIEEDQFQQAIEESKQQLEIDKENKNFDEEKINAEMEIEIDLDLIKQKEQQKNQEILKQNQKSIIIVTGYDEDSPIKPLISPKNELADQEEIKNDQAQVHIQTIHQSTHQNFPTLKFENRDLQAQNEMIQVQRNNAQEYDDFEIIINDEQNIFPNSSLFDKFEQKQKKPLVSENNDQIFIELSQNEDQIELEKQDLDKTFVQNSDEQKKIKLEYDVKYEQQRQKVNKKDVQEHEDLFDEDYIQVLYQNVMKSVDNQVQEEKKIEDLKSRQECGLICYICYDVFEEEENVFALQNCPNIFHKTCLEIYLELQIKDANFPLICPDHNCKKIIDENDIKELVSYEILERYQKFSIRKTLEQDPDTHWCLRPGCENAFIWQAQTDQGEDQNESQLLKNRNNCRECDVCFGKQCMQCKIYPFHDGMTCKEFQKSQQIDDNERIFIERMKIQGNTQCPHCKRWVQKARGCDHIRCACGKDFCFNCGGIYLMCKCKEIIRQQLRSSGQTMEESHIELRQIRQQFAFDDSCTSWRQKFNEYRANNPSQFPQSKYAQQLYQQQQQMIGDMPPPLSMKQIQNEYLQNQSVINLSFKPKNTDQYQTIGYIQDEQEQVPSNLHNNYNQQEAEQISVNQSQQQTQPIIKSSAFPQIVNMQNDNDSKNIYEMYQTGQLNYNNINNGQQSTQFKAWVPNNSNQLKNIQEKPKILQSSFTDSNFDNLQTSQQQNFNHISQSFSHQNEFSNQDAFKNTDFADVKSNQAFNYSQNQLQNERQESYHNYSQNYRSMNTQEILQNRQIQEQQQPFQQRNQSGKFMFFNRLVSSIQQQNVKIDEQQNNNRQVFLQNDGKYNHYSKEGNNQ